MGFCTKEAVLEDIRMILYEAFMNSKRYSKYADNLAKTETKLWEWLLDLITEGPEDIQSLDDIFMPNDMVPEAVAQILTLLFCYFGGDVEREYCGDGRCLVVKVATRELKTISQVYGIFLSLIAQEGESVRVVVYALDIVNGGYHLASEVEGENLSNVRERVKRAMEHLSKYRETVRKRLNMAMKELAG